MPRNVKFDGKFYRDTNVEMRTLKVNYDFSRDAGAQGAIALKNIAGDSVSLPDNAVITEVYLEGITDLASGGSATVALGYTGAATAFLGATAKDNAKWDVGAIAALGSLPLKMTQQVSILATIATADLTAGKFQIMIRYYEGA